MTSESVFDWQGGKLVGKRDLSFQPRPQFEIPASQQTSTSSRTMLCIKREASVNDLAAQVLSISLPNQVDS